MSLFAMRKGESRPILRPSLLVGAVFLLLLSLTPVPGAAIGAKGYVGSGKCKDCHREIHDQWRLTPHARMLRNAYQDPEAVEADNFTRDIPFKKSDIYFAIGSHWLQKYLTLMGGQFFILPKVWNIVEGRWERFSTFNWQEEPYPLYCNGCHVVGFDPKTRSYLEESIGCENCHGPGEKHIAKNGDPKLIVNPARLDTVRRDMICEACHTDGKDKATQTFPFAAGFKAGDDISDYYTDFFMPKPQSRDWYWGDMSYTERHRMFMFYQTKFYANDRGCEICQFQREGKGFMTRNQYCGSCHRKTYKSYEEHASHTEQQAWCDDCHVPTVTRGARRYSIHDHKFDFSRPKPPCQECHGPNNLDRREEPLMKDGKLRPEPPSHANFNINPVKITQNLTLSQACLRCHKDKDEAWARKGISDIKSRRKNAGRAQVETR